MNGEAEVIVATNAFGMGVDKSDVRAVAHVGMSPSLDTYFQEIGRAPLPPSWLLSSGVAAPLLVGAPSCEDRSTALAGIYDVQKIVRSREDPAARRLNREIGLFLSSPQQNTPKLKPSGAPPGPPI